MMNKYDFELIHLQIVDSKNGPNHRSCHHPWDRFGICSAEWLMNDNGPSGYCAIQSNHTMHTCQWHENTYSPLLSVTLAIRRGENLYKSTVETLLKIELGS